MMSSDLPLSIIGLGKSAQSLRPKGRGLFYGYVILLCLMAM
jgi:hypothetical protein